MLRKVWLLVAPMVLLCTTALAQGPTADDVVKKHLDARGGLEKIKAIQTLKVSGRTLAGGQLEAPITMSRKRPNLLRLEIVVQGKSIIQAFDGSGGWSIVPFRGSSDPEPMSEQEVKEVKSMADIDGKLVDYKAKGSTVELVGKEDLEGTEVYKLKLTESGGDITTYFLDGSSYLELKESSKRKMNDREVESVVYYGDFKPVSGVLMPHSWEVKVVVGGAEQPAFSMSIDTVEVNGAIDDNIFKMPPKAAAPAAEPAKP